MFTLETSTAEIYADISILHIIGLPTNRLLRQPFRLHRNIPGRLVFKKSAASTKGE